MNATLQGVDARAYLAGWLQGVTGMTTADINAIPDDKWNADFGGCTRSASALTADAISLLVWTTEALKGNVMTSGYEEGMARLNETCSTKSGAVAKLSEASQALADAIRQASDETLNKPVMAPWQMEAPLYMMAQIAVSHVWYHDGQLNYIQCLLGDEKIHWMGG